MKLTKQQIKKHHQAEEILQQDVLSYDDKIFVLENWNESAENINSFAGAFFTPINLAIDFSIGIDNDSTVIDLCSGIGMLSFFAKHYRDCNITCVELNPDYVRVGKKILPEATWINASVMSEEVLKIGHFDFSVSNPPFGKIKSGMQEIKRNYKGSEFEFIVMNVASQISDYGSFIVPQNSTPFKFSGNPRFEDGRISDKLSKFLSETGLEMELNSSIDTSVYLNDWNGVSPLCEVVDINFKK